MAVTRINGSKRLAEKTIVETLIDDKAISTRTIADSAVTAIKIDSNDDYTFNKVTAQDAVLMKTTAEVEGDLTAKANLVVEKDAIVNGNISVTGDGSFGGNVVITGNLQVDGDQVIANTSTLEVEDKNITINKGGNADSMTGSGITVENADGDNGSLVYDSNAASKWKLGIEGSEVEIVDLSSTQTLEGKTVKLTGEAIENKDNLEDALRALDDKVNNGTAYKIQEGDTGSSNYSEDEDGAHWDCGEEIVDDSPVHVYVSGLRLRSGTKDEDGNISNDYSVDYENGVIDFAEKAEGNIIVEYIPA
jgi:cytoskeletal protein CcmA (bactofilin family)